LPFRFTVHKCDYSAQNETASSRYLPSVQPVPVANVKHPVCCSHTQNLFLNFVKYMILLKMPATEDIILSDISWARHQVKDLN
jgi:hypothetical protein